MFTNLIGRSFSSLVSFHCMMWVNAVDQCSDKEFLPLSWYCLHTRKTRSTCIQYCIQTCLAIALLFKALWRNITLHRNEWGWVTGTSSYIKSASHLVNIKKQWRSKLWPFHIFRLFKSYIIHCISTVRYHLRNVWLLLLSLYARGGQRFFCWLDMQVLE